MRHWISITLVALALACAALLSHGIAAPATAPTDSVRPNVILLILDTFRADHVGFMGYTRRTSPNLDAWAGQSVVFDRAYAPAPWTVPSISSILTGVNPSVHHVLEKSGKYGTSGAPVQGDMLANEFETIPEAFRAAGYATAGFSANPWLTWPFGFAQGFDVFKMLSPLTVRPDVRETPYAKAPVILGMGRDWLDHRKSDRPFFLYLHVMDTHAPWNAPDDIRRRFVDEIRNSPAHRKITPAPRGNGYIRGIEEKTERVDTALQDRVEYWVALYDAAVAELDAQLGRFADDLKARGLWDNTLLVVTADHGEALYEQAGWSHGFSPFDHQLHVPLILHWPQRWPAARRVATTVGLVSLKATLLDLAGLSSFAFTQGRSFAPLANGAPPTDDGFAFAEGVKYEEFQKAACSAQRKIILDTRLNRAVYFDLTTDPLELRRDPIPLDDPKAAALKKQLDAALADNAAHQNRFPRRRDHAASRPNTTLKSLGYVSDGDGPPQQRPRYGTFKFDLPASSRPR